MESSTVATLSTPCEGGDGGDRGRVPIETLIQHEIERRLRNKSWSKLDMCFKWKLVSAFLKEHGYGSDAELMQEFRTMIKRNELDDVDYDNAAMKIVRMDIPRSCAK